MNNNILSVVFSFKNEEDNLPELIRRTRSVLTEECKKGKITDYELLFVNDASTDGSLEILLEELEKQKDIKIINMSRTFGISPCVLAGLKYAIGDGIVYLDADLQDAPELIAEMIDVWRTRNVDVVHTVRLSRKGETKVKVWITKLGYFILSRTSEIAIIPNAGDFKLLSRRVVNQLIGMKEKKPFMRGLTQWVGFKQERLYYHREGRFSGRSKFLVLGSAVIRNFLESAVISFSEMPLYLISLLGISIAVSAFLLMIYVIIGKYIGINVPGYTGIMATVLLLGGIQLVSLGVIGLYIGSIYLETKGRPNYIVESKYGFDEEPARMKRDK